MANTLATSDIDTISETMQDACVVCMAEAVPSCDEQILLEQLGSLHLGDGTQHEHHEQRKEAERYGDLEVDAAADDDAGEWYVCGFERDARGRWVEVRRWRPAQEPLSAYLRPRALRLSRPGPAWALPPPGGGSLLSEPSTGRPVPWAFR